MINWNVYSFMKYTTIETGKVPTHKEIIEKFPEATKWEIRDGMIEFQIAYENNEYLRSGIPEPPLR
jgi:hypothetical protein